MAELKFKVGDKVFVNGTIYQSANGTLSWGKSDKIISTIKKVAARGAHPYAVEDIYGWFNPEAIKPILEVAVGDKVKVMKAFTYSGKSVTLRYQDYVITELIDDKATVTHNNAQTLVVNAYNLKKI